MKNPAGRPRRTAGASIREWVNELVSSDVPAPDLRAIANDENAAPRKRIAAGRILIALDSGTLAAFGPYLRGEKTLEELHAAGVNTAVIKKARVTARGDREIELHDGGIEYDRLVNSTDLSPADAEKNRRIDAGKATDTVAYSTPTIHQLPLPPHLQERVKALPPPKTE